MQSRNSAKISVLKAIENEKDILFGQFSSTLTKQDKDKAWEKIFEIAKHVMELDDTKKCQYLRDVMWQNWRRSAMVRF